MARFIADKCAMGQEKEVKSSDLSKAYRAWCEENGERALKGRDYTDEISKKFDSYRKNTGIHYIGVGLLDIPASSWSEEK